MMLRPRSTAHLHDEEGSTLVLTIFYAALALVTILLVTAATSLYLERKRLFTLADGAALVGAESFELSEVTVTADGPRVTLRSSAVSAAVAEYLEVVPTSGFDALSLERASSVDGRSATVTLSSRWHPPLFSPLVPDGIEVRVTAVARSVFG